jgi:hypothetical protein
MHDEIGKLLQFAESVVESVEIVENIESVEDTTKSNFKNTLRFCFVQDETNESTIESLLILDGIGSLPPKSIFQSLHFAERDFFDKDVRKRNLFIIIFEMKDLWLIRLQEVQNQECFLLLL